MTRGVSRVSMGTWVEAGRFARHNVEMTIAERLGRARTWLREVGFTGERRALALLPLCLFGLLYLVLSVNAEPGWGPALLGLSLSYMIAFFAVAAGWFWARWFASGLGWSGFMVGLMALTMFGWHPTLGIYAGLHALVVLLLRGGKMAALYELRPEWRARFAMDEFGVARLGKAVTRGAGALPTLILWALAPREPQGMLASLETGVGAAGFVGLALLVVSLVGLVRRRSFAVLALGASMATVAVGVVLAGGGLAVPFEATTGGLLTAAGPFVLAPAPVLVLAFLTSAFLPWARPLARYLGRR